MAGTGATGGRIKLSHKYSSAHKHEATASTYRDIFKRFIRSFQNLDQVPHMPIPNVHIVIRSRTTDNILAISAEETPAPLNAIDQILELVDKSWLRSRILTNGVEADDPVSGIHCKVSAFDGAIFTTYCQ